MFANERAAKMKGDAAEKERAAKRMEEQQRAQVMRKMGVVQYYLNCSRRKKYLARIRAIDDDDEERDEVEDAHEVDPVDPRVHEPRGGEGEHHAA